MQTLHACVTSLCIRNNLLKKLKRAIWIYPENLDNRPSLFQKLLFLTIGKGNKD